MHDLDALPSGSEGYNPYAVSSESRVLEKQIVTLMLIPRMICSRHSWGYILFGAEGVLSWNRQNFSILVPSEKMPILQIDISDATGINVTHSPELRSPQLVGSPLPAPSPKSSEFVSPRKSNSDYPPANSHHPSPNCPHVVDLKPIRIITKTSPNPSLCPKNEITRTKTKNIYSPHIFISVHCHFTAFRRNTP